MSCRVVTHATGAPEYSHQGCGLCSVISHQASLSVIKPPLLRVQVLLVGVCGAANPTGRAAGGRGRHLCKGGLAT